VAAPAAYLSYYHRTNKHGANAADEDDDDNDVGVVSCSVVERASSSNQFYSQLVVILSSISHSTVRCQYCCLRLRRFTRQLCTSPRDFNLFFVHCSKMGTVTNGFDAKLANRPFSVFDFQSL